MVTRLSQRIDLLLEQPDLLLQRSLLFSQLVRFFLCHVPTVLVLPFQGNPPNTPEWLR